MYPAMTEACGRPNELLTTADVAKLARVDPGTVRQWERTGKLAADRTASGMRLFRRDAVVAFLEKREADR